MYAGFLGEVRVVNVQKLLFSLQRPDLLILYFINTTTGRQVQTTGFLLQTRKARCPELFEVKMGS